MGAMIDAAGLNPLQTLRAIAAWLKSRPENQDAESVRAQALQALEDKLRKQKAKIARLKNEAKKQDSMADKLAKLEQMNEADRKLRTLRTSVFEAEDAVDNAIKTGSGLPKNLAGLFPEADAILRNAFPSKKAEEAARPNRHEIGLSLTKEERAQVLKTLVDVYKLHKAPRELKSVGMDGNERYGYVYSPELFEKSDITGNMVRYYVTLPDGRIAHPTELFPNYTQAKIDTKLLEIQHEEKMYADAVKREAGPYFQFDVIDDAEAYWDDQSEKSTGGFNRKPTIFGYLERTVLTNGEKIIMVPTTEWRNNLQKKKAFIDAGWDEFSYRDKAMRDKFIRSQVVRDRLDERFKDIEAATPAPAQTMTDHTPIKGRPCTVKTAKGTRVDTVLALVEADSLIVSHDPASGAENPAFPQELQPRDRGRDSSQQWVQKTAARLDPDSLGRTSRADTGAPIIGPDRVVESGNGRSMAIQLAYQRGTADEYRQWLMDEAGYFGFEPDQVEAMRQPVLVRLRTSDIDRKAFVVEANQDDKLTFTATERAKTDAKRLDSHLLGLFSPSEDGDVTAASNQRFVQGFLQSLGDTEAAQYLTKDGKPTVALVHRLRAAVFSKAYNDDRLLEMMADQTKPEIQNVLNALSAAAPRFIDAQGYSRAGTEDVASGLVDGIEQSLDQRVVDAIVQATNTLMAARSQQQDVAEYVKQLGMFEDLPEGVPELAVFLAQNSRSAKRMAIAFKAMADFVKQDAISQQSDNLFGDPEPPRMADVVAAANAAIEREYGPEDGGMIGLFDSAASMTPLQTLRAILEWTKGRDQEAVHTAIQAYVASWQKQADQINAALAEFDWSQIKDSNSAQNAYLSLAEQVKTRGGNSLIDAAMSRLEQIGVSRWDNRLPDMGSTDAAKALHEASDAAREALGNILALGKQKDKELGKRALSNLEPDATPMDIAKAIFMKNGVQLGQSESPEFLKQLLEDIENKNADRLSRTLLNGLNKASIEVFEKLTGVKLVGKQALRMAAIDQWAGVTPEERAHRNLERQESMANARIARELESSWQGLEGIKVGTDKGVVTAQQWVLQCLEEGYTQPVRSSKPGVAQGYVLENPETGLFTRLKTTKFNDFIKAVIKSGGMNRAIKLLGLPTQAVPDQSEELTNVASDADLEHLFGKSPGQMFDSASMTPLQTLRAIAAWMKSKDEDDFAGVKAAAEEAAENALKKVRARIARLKNEAKKQGALADKVGVLQKIQDAERLQRTMRNQIFDVEDAIKAALSQKDASVMRDFSSTFPEAVAIVEKALSGRSGAEVDDKQGGHEPSSPQMITVPQITGKIGPTTFPEHPDFKTYDEVQEWIAKRSSEVGLSKKSFAATHEYSHALPKIEAVYKAAKTQFDENQKERGEDALRQMADVGVKVGDTVAWTKIGAFLSQESYQGVVVMRGGIPHVKLADKITVSSSGKLRQTNYLPWKPYMLPKASANWAGPKNQPFQSEQSQQEKISDLTAKIQVLKEEGKAASAELRSLQGDEKAKAMQAAFEDFHQRNSEINDLLLQLLEAKKGIDDFSDAPDVPVILNESGWESLAISQVRIARSFLKWLQKNNAQSPSVITRKLNEQGQPFAIGWKNESRQTDYSLKFLGVPRQYPYAMAIAAPSAEDSWEGLLAKLQNLANVPESEVDQYPRSVFDAIEGGIWDSTRMDSLADPDQTVYAVQQVPTDLISTDPGAYQWRDNTDDDGTEDRPIDPYETWDEDTPPLILHRRSDSTLWVVDGHHRLAKAERLDVPEVPAVILDEDDGYTVAAMRALCAMLNLTSEASEADSASYDPVILAGTAKQLMAMQ